MNKVLAEIIAGVIPHKMTRNRWRGILRFGLVNAIRLKSQIRKCHTTPSHYLTVCAIAKNEGPYFKEWIEWHLSQGVDKFYIYDNESTDGTKDILKPYIEQGVVEYKYWPGYRRQLAAYDDCLEHHRFDSRWIAFIDLDEFIVPVRDKSIPDFLAVCGSRDKLACLWQQRQEREVSRTGDDALQASFRPQPSSEPACEEHRRPTPCVHDDRLPRGGKNIWLDS